MPPSFSISNAASILFKAQQEREAWEVERVSSPHVQVTALVGVFSYVYERVRTLVEFPDEHLIRRGALERILKRRMAFSVERGEGFARNLVTEFISAHYLPNDWVPESALGRITHILEKYQVITSALKGKRSVVEDLCNSLASREIEQLLLPRFEDEALIASAVHIISQHNIVQGVSAELQPLLTEIAVRQTILREDRETIIVALLKKLVPDFNATPNPQAMYEAISGLERCFRHPMVAFLTTRIRTIRPILLLVQATVTKVGRAAFEEGAEQHDGEHRIQEIIFERFAKAKKIRFWSIVRVLIYIILSKILVLFLMELFTAGFETIPLLINFLTPPLFILILTNGVRSPRTSSVASMIKEVMSVLYEGRLAEAGKRFMRGRPVKRNPFLRALFWSFYAVFSLGILGAVGFGLLQLQYSIASLVVFYTFMSLVGFFGFRIRASFIDAVPIVIHEPIFVTFFDLLFLPFMNLGRYLARTFQKVNVIVMFLDMLIETPFKAFFGIMEDWLTFVKEKKEEITREN